MSSIFYLENEKQIIEILAKLCQVKCCGHNQKQAEQICTHTSCINNLTCFLCPKCVNIHSSNHISLKSLKPIENLFSLKLWEKVTDRIKRMDNQGIQDTLLKVDNIFLDLKNVVNKIIDDY